MMEGPLIVVELPGGVPAAFTAHEIAAGKQRAAELGFGAPAKNAAGDPLNEPAKLLDSTALGELLGVDPTTCEQMARDGRLPSIRIGRLLRFEPRVCIGALRVNDGKF